jgi:hypothetical protein
VRLRETLRLQAAIFAVAVPLNLAWEVAQAQLYAFPRQGIVTDLVGCLVPSLGDGLMTLAIYWSGWLVFRRPGWVLRPGAGGFALAVLVGLLLAIGVEWNALYLTGAWAYGPGMPLVPVLGVGLLPVLQMLVLPPITFLAVGSWRHPGPGRAS